MDVWKNLQDRVQGETPEEGDGMRAALMAIRKHHKEKPTHGFNCVCMDKVIWSLKAEINSVVPGAYTWIATDEQMKEIDSLRYVLRIVMRGL